MDGFTPGGAECPATGGATVLCALAYPSALLSVTVDISAWSVPVTASLVHNVVSQYSFGGVAGIVLGAATAGGQPTIRGAFTPSSAITTESSFQDPVVTEGGFYKSVTMLVEPYRCSRSPAPI